MPAPGKVGPAAPAPAAGPADVYGWVKLTREGLLAFCDSLSLSVYTAEREGFGWGSIRNTLIHVADCYRFWLAEKALGQDAAGYEAGKCPDVPAARRVLEAADAAVARFCDAFAGDAFFRPLSLKVRWQPGPMVVTPLWLLTHTVTHEFHHKGQIVAFGRLWGHPAPETDLALPPWPAGE